MSQVPDRFDDDLFVRNTALRPEKNSERQRLVARLERLAWLLDASIPIPFTRFRAGIDSLLGLVPGVGDIAGAALSASVLVGAWRLGLPWYRLAPMAGRSLLEAAIGVIPLVGDIFDIGYKANLRNVRAMIDALETVPDSEPREWSALLVIGAALLVGAVIAGAVLLVGIVVGIVTALRS